MNELSIRTAVESDADAACLVLRRSITECCIEDHQNDPERLAAWLRNKTPENVVAWITHENNMARIAESGNNAVGFSTLQTSGYLTLLYVTPEALHRGVGKALLQSLETTAIERGITELTLESSKTAIDFYSRNGYESSGPPNTDSSIVGYPMRKQLHTSS